MRFAGAWHSVKIRNLWPFLFKTGSTSCASVKICFVLLSARVSVSINSGLRLSQPRGQWGRLLHITPSHMQETLSSKLCLLSRINLSLITKTTSFWEFYIHGSVHRNSILISSNKMQQYAGTYLLQNHSTRFGCPSHPSSGVHKTLTATSGTCHSICETTFLQRGL